ncbi:14850_t:CDS:1, partial [Gigaspora margarita]
FVKFNQAKTKFKKDEDEYFKTLDRLFKVANASDDEQEAFKFLQKIQDEGNNFNKSQVKNKLGMRLLGGFGCKQDIREAQRLIEEASNLGLTAANVWIKHYSSKQDFGASDVIK